MRIFISTGEVSGDMQGAMLITALKQVALAMGIELEIVALGGDRMASAGATLLGNTTAIGSVGIVEAIKFIAPTLQIQNVAKKYLQQNPPDVLILIDYIGPNLAIAGYVRKHLKDIPIIYYIAPQDWVWAPLPQNTQQLVNITDLLLAIFPQEARYFQDLGVRVIWVGHPLLDRMQDVPPKQVARESLGIKPYELIVTLLPASRAQEIKYLLPTICEAAALLQEKLPQVKFLIPVSLKTYYDDIAAAVTRYGLNATLLQEKTYEAIAAADLAITKSGTVNLEIALLNVPQVVIYKVNPFSIWIARKLFNFSIPFMSPVNLLVMRALVPELLQEKATVENIVAEAKELLLNREKLKQIEKGYQQMRSLLGETGVCQRAATEILNFRKQAAKVQ